MSKDPWSKSNGPYLHGHYQAFMRKKGLSKGFFRPEEGKSHKRPRYMNWDLQTAKARAFHEKRLRYFAARTGRLGFHDRWGAPTPLYKYPRKNHIDWDYINAWQSDERERQEWEERSTLNDVDDDEATQFFPAHEQYYLSDLRRRRENNFERHQRWARAYMSGERPDLGRDLGGRANLIKHAVAAVAARNMEKKMGITFPKLYRNVDALHDGRFQMQRLLHAAPGGNIQINGRDLPPVIQDSVVSFLMPSPADLT